MLKEFKKFISRGNVIDLAVGVMIGAAFGKIVSSLVDDIFMPLIGVAIGGLSFSELSFTIGESVVRYGLFIQNIINFIVIAFVLFLIIKFVNKLKPAKEEKAEKPKKADDVVLLEEIRDLLKKQNKK